MADPQPGDPRTLSADEVRRRDALLAARGPVIATVGFPREVVAASAEHADRPTALAFEPGEYEILEIAGDAIALRRRGARAERWAYLDVSAEADYVLSAARDDLAELEFPESVTHAIAIDRELVWITNPTGKPLRLFVGHARTGAIVAVYVQLSWSESSARTRD